MINNIIICLMSSVLATFITLLVNLFLKMKENKRWYYIYKKVNCVINVNKNGQMEYIYDYEIETVVSNLKKIEIDFHNIEQYKFEVDSKLVTICKSDQVMVLRSDEGHFKQKSIIKFRAISKKENNSENIYFSYYVKQPIERLSMILKMPDLYSESIVELRVVNNTKEYIQEVGNIYRSQCGDYRLYIEKPKIFTEYILIARKMEKAANMH